MLRACPPPVYAEGVQTLVLLLAPFAPHMAEELWHQLGHATSVHQAAWPVYDPEGPGKLTKLPWSFKSWAKPEALSMCRPILTKRPWSNTPRDSDVGQKNISRVKRSRKLSSCPASWSISCWQNHNARLRRKLIFPHFQATALLLIQGTFDRVNVPKSLCPIFVPGYYQIVLQR